MISDRIIMITILIKALVQLSCRRGRGRDDFVIPTTGGFLSIFYLSSAQGSEDADFLPRDGFSDEMWDYSDGYHTAGEIMNYQIIPKQSPSCRSRHGSSSR